LPALGLSNKATNEPNENGSEEKTRNEPPLETQLLQETLWPEKDKLYGHGFELVSIAASHDGEYIASSCKVRKHKSDKDNYSHNL
jgi:elongator complex protein 2